MVGIFSRFSGGRSGHRRTKSADARQPLPENVEVASFTPAAASHGIEVAVEFKPVEHPTEPIDHDQPVKCPLPEPSILNDGRIWKERRSSASTRLRPDLPVVKEASVLEPETGAMKSHSAGPQRRTILPSLSAPEHNLINYLEEYNAARD